uniref:Uncharacterized protein n=2 Tax=Bracon brevicornis TaxID=1563983 RepID=A0A6V7KI15_9HYME
MKSSDFNLTFYCVILGIAVIILYPSQFVFQHLDGVIVILSEEGRLEACYLGAEPSLFVAPPIHRRGFDYKAAEEELVELRKMAKSSLNSGGLL